MIKNVSFSSARLIVSGVLVVVLLSWLSAHLLFTPADNAEELSESSVVKIETRSFTLEVVDRGVVSPARISPISSQISSNQAKIVWLVKEGAVVRKGMIVARFDTKPFDDSLLKAEQAYADAQAVYLTSEKMLFLQKEEEAGKIEEAERKLEIAEIQADNTNNGSGPLKRRMLEQKLHQAERGLEISRSELSDLEVLLKKGHVSLRERDKALDKVSTANEQLDVAKAELDNFDAYVWPKMEREAELLVNGARSNLTRVRRTAELLIQNREAELEKNRRMVENKRGALNQAKVDLANCEILSPTDGILLYAEIPRDSGKRKVQIGDSVWVGQTFLQVPDTTALIAEINVREVDVAQISPGMTAYLEVDAFPGRIFSGRVESVASLARDDDENSNVRRFYTRIPFLDDTAMIHVGMSVTARIVYRQLDSVIAVPIGSVVYKQSQTFVRKKESDGFIEVPVTLGARGQLWFEVLDGLQVGDHVVQEGL